MPLYNVKVGIFNEYYLGRTTSVYCIIKAYVGVMMPRENELFNNTLTTKTE